VHFIVHNHSTQYNIEQFGQSSPISCRRLSLLRRLAPLVLQLTYQHLVPMVILQVETFQTVFLHASNDAI